MVEFSTCRPPPARFRSCPRYSPHSPELPRPPEREPTAGAVERCRATANHHQYKFTMDPVEIADPLGFLLGTWELSRFYTDHRAGTTAAFHGLAVLTTDASADRTEPWQPRQLP